MTFPATAFREIRANNLNAGSLQDEMRAHGYVLIRRLLPSDDLQRLLGEIAQIVFDAGWLLPQYDPLDRMANAGAACGEPDPQFKRVSKQVFCLESFHALAHHPVLQGAMRQLVGPDLLIHPKSIPRMVFPNSEQFIVHEHQDHTAIDGDPESFTAWMPLHDCPAELGPLQVLEASHRFGLQKTGVGSGYIPKCAALGEGWAGGTINAGDVLIFHSLTVHAATANVSNQLRISMDCRFQDCGRAINPAELVFPGGSPNGRSWETTYAKWQSDELKYYWKKMPLKFKPSRVELTELANTADTEAMRARYSRILSMIELEMPD